MKMGKEWLAGGVMALLVAGCGSSDLELSASDSGKSFALERGGHANISLQTIGPGNYGDPSISSAALGFQSMDYDGEQIPAGPRQHYHFVAQAPGRALLTIPHVGRPEAEAPPFTVTIDVTD